MLVIDTKSGQTARPGCHPAGIYDLQSPESCTRTRSALLCSAAVLRPVRLLRDSYRASKGDSRHQRSMVSYPTCASLSSDISDPEVVQVL